MCTIETTVTISEDGRITVPVAAGLPPGRYHAVLTLEPAPAAETGPFDLPVHDSGPWPAGLSLRREDLYGDDGR